MKKIFVFVLIFTSLFILFAIPSFAADKGEEYWQDFTELVPEGTVDKDMDNAAESVGIKALLLEIINAISGESGAVFSFLAMLFGLSLLIALAECRGLGEKNELSRYTSAGVSTVCAFFIFKAIYGICLTVSGSIAEISAVLKCAYNFIIPSFNNLYNPSFGTGVLILPAGKGYHYHVAV